MGTKYQEMIRRDLWNTHYQVGTEVTVQIGDGEQLITKTVGPAEVNNGLAVVPVADLAEPAPLSNVTPTEIRFDKISSVALELTELSPEKF